jgi:hypothetical protein
VKISFKIKTWKVLFWEKLGKNAQKNKKLRKNTKFTEKTKQKISILKNIQKSHFATFPRFLLAI